MIFPSVLYFSLISLAMYQVTQTSKCIAIDVRRSCSSGTRTSDLDSETLDPPSKLRLYSLRTSSDRVTVEMKDEDPSLDVLRWRISSGKRLVGRRLVCGFVEQLHPGKQKVCVWTTPCASKTGETADSDSSCSLDRQGKTKNKRSVIGNGDGEELMSRHQTSRSKAQTVITAVTRRPTV